MGDDILTRPSPRTIHAIEPGLIFDDMRGLFKNLLAGFFCLMSAISSSGQDKSIEEQRVKLLLLREQLNTLKSAQPDSAAGIATRELQLAISLEQWLVAGEMEAVLADLQLSKGSMAEANDLYAAALSYLQALPERQGWTKEEVSIAMVRANIFLAQDRYITAHASYERLLELADSLGLGEISAHVTNNLGVLFMRLQDDEAAKGYFKEARTRFAAEQMDYDASVCDYNLAAIAERQGFDTLALSRYAAVAQRMAEMEQWGNYVSIQTAISRIHRIRGNLKEAEIFNNIALDVLDSDLLNSDAPQVLYRTESFYNAAELARQQGQTDRAWRFGKKCLDEALENDLQDLIAKSSLMLSGLAADLGEMATAYELLTTHLSVLQDIQREASIREIVQLQMSHEFDRKMQQAELAEFQRTAERERKNALLTRALLVTLLIALALAVLFLLQRNKAARALLREKSLELEKTELNNSLAYKSKELATTMMYLLEKNQFITSVANQLLESKGEFSQKNQVVVQRIINELLKNSSKKAWDEFEAHFKEVHFEFYEVLREQFPDLTVNEKRLCAFLRLNLTTKEIAAITHQSIKSINMARFRMRKKMNLETDVDLVAYLSAL